MRCEDNGELHALGASLLKKETSVSIDRNLGQVQSKPECDGGNEQFLSPPRSVSKSLSPQPKFCSDRCLSSPLNYADFVGNRNKHNCLSTESM